MCLRSFQQGVVVKELNSKNIIKIKGIPLIGYSAKVIQKIKFIDRTVVSTDSQKIKKVSEKYGLDVPFMRPKRISGDRISDVDVIKDVLEKVEKIDKKISFDFTDSANSSISQTKAC